MFEFRLDPYCSHEHQGLKFIEHRHKPLHHGSELLELSNMVNLCLCACLAAHISRSGALARWRAAGEDQEEAALQRDGG